MYISKFPSPRLTQICTGSSDFLQSFAYEVDMLGRLSHPNIVKLLGFLEDLETGYACMVFTWEENGNVQEFLAIRGCQIPERISLVRVVHTPNRCGTHSYGLYSRLNM